MGYTTEFRGSLLPDKPFTEEITNYINMFSDVRHVKRDVNKIKAKFGDWEKYSYHGELGYEAEYFVGDYKEQNKYRQLQNGAKTINGSIELENQRKVCYNLMFQEDIIDYNTPPKNCPGLWCQWVIEDGKVVWDGGEKFYNYVEWLDYLIKNFFIPEGYILNGEIRWQGEDMDDRGIICVSDNKITVNNPDL